ncbi:MAG: hypothetical protein H6815_11325 [Phycisphaeraceae bacterium]|nr:hypothetical protein [Phycisphaerales bacterium]MCB9861028.1 hypothetical protein [Phycisphaeraceae bacterium]
MGFFSKLFGKPGNPWRDDDASEHAHSVMLSFPDDVSRWPDGAPRDLLELDDLLEAALEKSGAGWIDGHAVDGDSIEILILGKDADTIWDAIAPVLEPYPLPKNAFVLKRYGENDDAREERIDLHWEG